MRNRTEQFLWEAPTAGDAVRSLLITSAELFTGENTPGCLLASATASGSKESADVRAAVTEVRRGIEDRLFARIEYNVTIGILPYDTQVAALANFAIFLIQGMSVLARDGAQRYGKRLTTASRTSQICSNRCRSIRKLPATLKTIPTSLSPLNPLVLG